MITLALTGSIGMGKSTVAAMFAEAGVPVFDADAVVRAAAGPGRPAGPAIEARFPGHDARRRGRSRRAGGRGARRPRALAALEAIVHPAVRASATRFIVDHGDAPALAVRHSPAVRNRRRRRRSTR